MDQADFTRNRPEGYTKIWTSIILCTLLVEPTLAKSKRSIPRFVSTRSTEANLRVGPGSDYPIEWVFVKKDIPVEITAEFDTWRRVRDFEGTEGWFHQSMLKSQRFGVISIPEATIHHSNSATSSGVVKLSQGVIVKIKKCRDNWCYVTLDKFEGWLPRNNLWGAYPNEKIG